MRVKICGITSLDDAKMAIDARADALGFVFYKASPRYISPQDARKIIDKLPPFVEKVGLFVNEDATTINLQAKESHITLAQIHFDAPQSLFDALELPYIRVIRATCKEDIIKHKDEYRLVDAYCDAYGGMGKRVNLEWFKGVECSNIILAGGLDSANVTQTHPYGFYGVDVSSGVEKSKGIKDAAKVKAFIDRVKCY